MIDSSKNKFNINSLGNIGSPMDSDLLIVERDGISYKVSVDQIKSQGSASYILYKYWSGVHIPPHPNPSITTAYDLANAHITLHETEFYYDGTPKCPEITVTLEMEGKTEILQQGRDYVKSYSNNVNVGNAQVIISQVAGNQYIIGSQSKDFVIQEQRGDWTYQTMILIKTDTVNQQFGINGTDIIGGIQKTYVDWDD